jgi:hypothetical protein
MSTTPNIQSLIETADRVHADILNRQHHGLDASRQQDAIANIYYELATEAGQHTGAEVIMRHSNDALARRDTGTCGDGISCPHCPDHEQRQQNALMALYFSVDEEERAADAFVRAQDDSADIESVNPSGPTW